MRDLDFLLLVILAVKSDTNRKNETHDVLFTLSRSYGKKPFSRTRIIWKLFRLNLPTVTDDLIMFNLQSVDLIAWELGYCRDTTITLLIILRDGQWGVAREQVLIVYLKIEWKVIPVNCKDILALSYSLQTN